MVNEARIVQLLGQGDQLAIHLIYERYAAALYGTIYRIVHTEEIAEDVLQQTFVEIWKRRQGYDPKKSGLFTWLLNLARSTALETTRSAYYEHILPSISATDSLPGQSSGPLNAGQLGIKKMANDLEIKYKEVIDLIQFKGFSLDEVARALGISEDKAKVRAEIALKELSHFFHNSIMSCMLMITSIWLHHG